MGSTSESVGTGGAVCRGGRSSEWLQIRFQGAEGNPFDGWRAPDAGPVNMCLAPAPNIRKANAIFREFAA